MKKIVCELCEGTQFTKEGGYFVCHGCGTRYSIEEARSMMREVEGEPEPFVGGAPVVTIPVGNPYQQQIDNILLLASNAYAASNNEETEKYCNRAIELDAGCYKAWLLKGKAIGWSSKIDNNRIAEAAHSFKQAVDFAPDEEKESLTNEAVEELKRLGLACISLRQKRFSQFPDKQELDGFVSDMEPLVNGLVVLLSKESEVMVQNMLNSLLGAFDVASIKFIGMKSKAEAAGVPKEYFSQVAVMMANAANDGFNTATNEYRNNNFPVPNNFQKTMQEVDNCIMLMGIAIDACDDDFDDDVKHYYDMSKMQEYCINMTAYSSFSSSYRDWSLTAESKRVRRERISGYKTKIEEIKQKKIDKEKEEREKAEKDRKARIEAYWEAHADEKTALEAEKKQLEEKQDALNRDIARLSANIGAIKKREKEPVRSEAESNKLTEQIRDLEKRRANLGMFSGREKKEITDKIALIQGRVDSLKGKIEQEKKARSAEIRQSAEPLEKELYELQEQLDAAAKRISAIEAEFEKDPEA